MIHLELIVVYNVRNGHKNSVHFSNGYLVVLTMIKKAYFYLVTEISNFTHTVFLNMLLSISEFAILLHCLSNQDLYYKPLLTKAL